MPNFMFAHRSVDGDGEVGFVRSGSFAEALDAIQEQLPASEGDLLELGVQGFPPARYLCVGKGLADKPAWRPLAQLAA
ncbi:MAG TPA: hypothetical protein VJ672_03675 [Gemmatimonadaceae bacterium]|nr:hypothetical protein [Gemmatimonadaceae bacterium]